MERRFLIAICLSVLVLWVWQSLFVKPVPKPAGTTSAAASSSSAQSSSAATPTAVTPGSTAAPAAAAANVPSAPQAATVLGDSAERDVRIETNEVIAVFTNRGARLKSWRLKRYLNQQKQPQELVEAAAGTLPFTLTTADPQVNQTVNNALYTSSGSAPVVTAAGTDLHYEFRDSAGIHVVKDFHLDQASFVASALVNVERDGHPVPAAIDWGPGLGDVGEMTRGMQPAQGLLFQGGSVTRLSASDITKQPLRTGDFHYAGVDDNYFMAVAWAPGESKVSYQPVSIPPPMGSKDAARALIAFSIEPVKSTIPVKFFIGPKDFDLLRGIDPQLSQAVNFGRFSLIVVPLLGSLKWINGFIGNWGWSIVILTIIINGIMAPLRHKQVTSMRKMQQIQPEVKAIQDRYAKLKATDPGKQKMNEELMALYREKKVNPAAGCVPMLLTLPIVLAMWALLQTSIELRGAPWFGWIHDLSAHDPYYVLPVMMMATQFWQQLTMPSAGADPTQQKMMLFMPLVMGFIFLFLPAGALLYYVVTNFISIGQQYLTNYLIGPPPTRTMRPAAERRLKRVGGGKTDAAMASDR